MPTNTDGVYEFDGTEAGSLKGRLNLIATALTALLGWRGRSFRGTVTAMEAFRTDGLAQTGDKWYCTTTSGGFISGVTYRYSGAAWVPWESGWIAYVPTLSASGGALGAVTALSARYKWQAGSAYVTGNASIAIGTGTGSILIPLPTEVVPVGDIVGVAVNISAGTTGTVRASNGGANLTWVRYDGTFPIAGTQFARWAIMVGVS